ncbi:hypothetical protein CEUSTIGMA_g9188.t1 [Chlamydomonas eustigma]|uniref:Uncharacterized protein n=1 Tax=Chlamydomonas eustigma TaxID=1157962 RepID=A0A250XG46_9CHLO|nr:hypothetical protein CEUSTIGMA_g9188.t1 [Chlamydomonas eustigma]|eukprot:GAX81760.1 hypothetical protein CEUSTIGMA_g9188.t1 [Chlamydomonas eustigma]
MISNVRMSQSGVVPNNLKRCPSLATRPTYHSRRVCKSGLNLLMELAEGAAVGTVDAPIGVVIGGAVLVTLASTALIPLVLNPGQEAADKIFSAKDNGPRQKTSVKKSKK